MKLSAIGIIVLALAALGVVALAYLGVSSFMGSDQVAAATTDISSSELENFFRKHTVDGTISAAMMKRSLGRVSYIATIHGFPNNRVVCEETIEPFNKDPSKSVIPGEYFCEDLR